MNVWKQHTKKEAREAFKPGTRINWWCDVRKEGSIRVIGKKYQALEVVLYEGRDKVTVKALDHGWVIPGLEFKLSATMARIEVLKSDSRGNK